MAMRSFPCFVGTMHRGAMTPSSGARDQTYPHIQLGGADWVALFRLLQQAKARAMAGKKLAVIQGIGSIPDSVLFVCFVLNL